jgi:hypothetical protein
MQVKHYFKGIGADESGLTRLFSGLTGDGPTGYEYFIRQAYEVSILHRPCSIHCPYKRPDRSCVDRVLLQFCCLNCCPSDDEVFLFGFSRGGCKFLGYSCHGHNTSNRNQSLPRLWQTCSISSACSIRGILIFKRSSPKAFVFTTRLSNRTDFESTRYEPS